MLRVNPALFHHFRAGRAQAELMEPDHLSIQTDVLIPNLSHSGFNRDASTAFVRQNFITVFLRLTIKTVEARHRNHSYTITRPFRLGARMLQFAPARHDNQIQFRFLFPGNVSATQDSFAAQFHIDIV